MRESYWKINDQLQRLKPIRPYFYAVLLALTLRWLVLEAYVIPSESMLPSLLVNDHVFVNKFTYGVRPPFGKEWILRFNEPQNGEVIVFKYPEDESKAFIKRIVGVPGDVITYDKGLLRINDVIIQRELPLEFKVMEYIKDSELPGGKSEYKLFHEKISDYKVGVLLKKEGEHKAAGPIRVPEDHYFVLGDNRDNSNDSRFWGFVPRGNILGKAMFIWLSCDQTLSLVDGLCNPLSIRWDRLNKPVHVKYDAAQR